MRRRRQTGLAIAAAILVALAPSRPAFADAITRVKGKILDNHGKPLASVTIYFEAVEIKKRVGPLRTSKQGEFFIATLDTSVAKKWRVVPDLSGYKTVKVTYEIIDSEKNERGRGDVILGTKQEYPELLFALVGDEGRNVVDMVMAKESEFVTAVQEERQKKAAAEGGQVAGNVGNATAGAPAAAATPAAPAVPSGGKEILQKAKALTDAGQHQEAIELYRSYLAKDPTGNPAVYYYLGKSLFESDELPAAAQAFQKGLELNKDMKGAHFYLGNIALKSEQASQAIAEYQKEIALTPDSDSLYFNLGNAYMQMGDDASALKAFEQAAVLNNTKPEPLMQMAAVYEKQKDTAKTPDEKKTLQAKAAEIYDKIKAIDPKNAAILFYNVGARAKNENRQKDAVQAFTKSVEIDPSYAPAHRELGYALVGVQDFQGAIKQFQEYLKLSPQAPDAQDVKQTIAALR